MLSFLPKPITPWSLDRLRPYADKGHTYCNDQLAKVTALMVEFGWAALVMVDRRGAIIADHGRIIGKNLNIGFNDCLLGGFILRETDPRIHKGCKRGCGPAGRYSTVRQAPTRLMPR